MKMMYDRGYDEQEVIDLHRFVDWVLTLPPDLAEAFNTDLIAYEGEKTCIIKSLTFQLVMWVLGVDLPAPTRQF